MEYSFSTYSLKPKTAHLTPCYYWWYHKLSLRQLTVPPVTKKLSKWRTFVFNTHLYISQKAILNLPRVRGMIYCLQVVTAKSSHYSLARLFRSPFTAMHRRVKVEFTGHWWIPLTKASDVELWCFFIYTWTNCWGNKRDTGDLRRLSIHYDATLMCPWCFRIPTDICVPCQSSPSDPNIAACAWRNVVA